MPKPSLLVSNKPLSISNLTGISSSSLNLSSDNIGVVEIMLLHLLEKAISSKSSWLNETKNSMIALQRLRLKDCSPPTFVVPEHNFCPEDTSKEKTPPQPSVFPEHGNFDPDIAAIERELVRHVSILTKLLWRYNLVPSILSNDPALADFIPSTGQTIDWRPLQLTRLRWSLLRVFSHREEPIPFSQRRSPERSVSVENFIGAFAGMSSSRSNPSLDTSHTGDPILTETMTAFAPNINVRTDVRRSTRNQLMPPRLTSKFPSLNINEEESSPLFHDPSRYSHFPPPPLPFIKPTSALNNHFHRKNKNPDTSNASSSHSSEPVVLGRFIRLATLELPSAGLADLTCSSQSPSLFPQRMFENPACSFRTVTSPASVIHRIAATRKSLLAQTSSTPPADEKSNEFR